MEYNFADIPDSKKRTEVIQEFVETMKRGNHSVQEQIEVRIELVKKALSSPNAFSEK